ncbi:MAG: competence/damage-inducible protein A [Xanthobacteraceae bacterium]
MSASQTAAVLLIGDEILSGRTKDKNLGFIADYLTALGIDLREGRIVPDVEDEIVAAVNSLRSRYTYVFTTGGIGPTHDDITADCVAKAFGVSIDVDPRARALLLTRIAEKDLNEARLRMARIPAGADLILNKVSAAPGFRIGNVHVFAGVPAIMQAMLDEVAPTLKTGARMLSATVRADLREGDIGSELGAIAKAVPEVTIGSYPFFDEQRGPNTNVVIRARDPDKLAAAKAAIEEMLRRVRAEARAR